MTNVFRTLSNSFAYHEHGQTIQGLAQCRYVQLSKAVCPIWQESMPCNLLEFMEGKQDLPGIIGKNPGQTPEGKDSSVTIYNA